MKEGNIYNYEVGSYDIDFTDRSTYVALINYIFKVAGVDADNRGFGVVDLNHDNCSWVLTRLSTEFSRRLPLYEKFTIETWVSDVNRLLTTRNMILRDSKGKEFGWAVTQWTVIDVEKRRALDIRKHVNQDNQIIDKPSPISAPERLRGVEEALRRVEHSVVYSDLDFNRHVNSSKYIEWMIDMLPLEWATNKWIERFDMNFLNETLHGDLLTISYQQQQESLLFEVMRGETAICRSSMRFTEEGESRE